MNVPRFVLLLLIVLAGAAPAQAQRGEIAFLQVNDIYEIGPVQGGRYGGLARVATFRKQLAKRYPHLWFVLPGDFLSPSVYNRLEIDGKPAAGAQMVAALNAAGLDVATFGNHEFDLKEAQLRERMAEARFGWVSANVRQADGKPFTSYPGGAPVPVPDALRLPVPTRRGDTLYVLMTGVTLPYTKTPYVQYGDVNADARRTLERFAGTYDAAVAMTHLSIGEDRELARDVPAFCLLMGGHEHQRHYEKVGRTAIAKADANARTVYVHRVKIRRGKPARVKSKYYVIDDKLAPDSAAAAVVEQWQGKMRAAFAAQGFDATARVLTAAEPLDGLETSVRNRQTNLGAAICRAMRKAAPDAQFALLNGGSIRVDDLLEGVVTEYDILRTLPFAGGIWQAELRGDVLQRAVAAGAANRGTGGYLQLDGLTEDARTTAGAALDPAAWYVVVLPEYLFSGKENRLDFLKNGANGVRNAREVAPDIRRVVIDGLRR